MVVLNATPMQWIFCRWRVAIVWRTFTVIFAKFALETSTRTVACWTASRWTISRRAVAVNDWACRRAIPGRAVTVVVASVMASDLLNRLATRRPDGRLRSSIEDPNDADGIRSLLGETIHRRT